MSDDSTGLRAVARLGDGLLLAVVGGQPPSMAASGTLQVSPPGATRSQAIAVETLLSTTLAGGGLSVVLLRLATPLPRGWAAGPLRMGGRAPGAGRWPAGWDAMVSDIGAACRSGPAALPAAARAQALDAVVAAVEDRDRSLEVQRGLRRLRDCLREPLAPVVIDPASRVTARVEALARVDPHRVYVRGWVGDLHERLARLTVVAPTGDRAEIAPAAYRFRRSDIAELFGVVDQADDPRAGFAAVAEFDRRNDLSEGWLVEVGLGGAGAEAEDVCVPVLEPMADVRRVLIGDLPLDEEPRYPLREHHLAPALSRLQRRHRSLVEVEAVDQWGTPPAAAEATVIVPLYGRLDLMEHQLAQFAGDREMWSADVIYVLDSPERKDQFRGAAGRLHRLYGVPFRAVVLNRNAGFSGANNMAAGLATGRLLVLMNSDVLPREPGWLGRMVHAYDRRPRCGALGVKLLFEDDTLQHAGMSFERSHEGDLWANDHVYKGLHRSLPAAGVSRTVPAVTAALLMVSADRFAEVGGLRDEYIQGDYEDSDLCLRLTEAGYEIWYEATIELYHLEGQSYPTPMRALNATYNRWLHTRTWGHRIAEIVAGRGSAHQADRDLEQVPVVGQLAARHLEAGEPHLEAPAGRREGGRGARRVDR